MLRKVILIIPVSFLLLIVGTSSYADKKMKRKPAKIERQVENKNAAKYDDPNAPLIFRKTLKPITNEKNTEIDLN